MGEMEILSFDFDLLFGFVRSGGLGVLAALVFGLRLKFLWCYLA